MTHELKILPEFFEAVSSREKSFEIRKNDRNFKVGDWLILKEWDNEKEKYTGREVKRYVSYIFYGTEDFGLHPDYCVMSLKMSAPMKSYDGEVFK